MARIRTIKPEFFTSEDIVELSPLARLLYIALWCEADREGRFEWKPKTFKIRYLPMDDCDIDALLKEITDRSLVVRYTTQSTQSTTQSGQASGTPSGQQLGYIPAFIDHQFINNKEAKSVLPEPEAPPRSKRDNNASTTRATHDVNAPSLKGREGKGKECIGKEGKENTSTPTPNRPTLEECKSYALEAFNLNGKFAESFFAKYEENGWIGSNGTPVLNWKNTMRIWVEREKNPERFRPEPPKEEPDLRYVHR